MTADISVADLKGGPDTGLSRKGQMTHGVYAEGKD